MNFNKNLLILFSAIVILTGSFIYSIDLSKKNNAPATFINSFEECVVAGNQVMESYPRQCSANGRVFIEEVGNEVEKIDLIRINNPRPNQLIISPLVVIGEARGIWYFEADFPVRLLDANENEIAVGFLTAVNDWMTEEFVEFQGEITFDYPQTDTGSLILEKANPSGLPENEDELRIPVRFD